MISCPVCESRRIVLVIAPQRRALCPACGARWSQAKGWPVLDSSSLSPRVHPSVGRLKEDPHPAA